MNLTSPPSSLVICGVGHNKRVTQLEPLFIYAHTFYFPPPTPVAPEAPTNVYGEQAGLRTARVYWQAPDDNGFAITTYEVTYSREGVDEGVLSANGSPASTFVDVENLLTGSSYAFTVQATNSGGSSAQSSTSDEVSHLLM